jgi:hypothetical protein
MARMPHPGSDEGNWGQILNDFLAQVHDTDGTLREGSIGKSKLSSSVQTSLGKADDAISSSQAGTINGVATLDSNARLTTAQLPTSVLTKNDDSSNAGKAVDAYTGLPISLINSNVIAPNVRIFFGTFADIQPLITALPSGTEYVWTETDGHGVEVNDWSGIA